MPQERIQRVESWVENDAGGLIRRHANPPDLFAGREDRGGAVLGSWDRHFA